jgi:hypothetical protein
MRTCPKDTIRTVLLAAEVVDYSVPGTIPGRNLSPGEVRCLASGHEVIVRIVR